MSHPIQFRRVVAALAVVALCAGVFAVPADAAAVTPRIEASGPPTIDRLPILDRLGIFFSDWLESFFGGFKAATGAQPENG